MREEIFTSFLIFAVLSRLLEDGYSLHKGNIYGIKVQNGNKTRRVILKPVSWIRRHRIKGKSFSFPKLRSFEHRNSNHCADSKNIEIVKIKRIGGGYPYGPKNGTIGENRICKIGVNPTVSFLVNEILKDVQSNFWMKRKKMRNGIWCGYCRSYWKKMNDIQRMKKCCKKR